eukprot:724558-Pleurochrysis_carterae.AAC.1
MNKKAVRIAPAANDNLLANRQFGDEEVQRMGQIGKNEASLKYACSEHSSCTADAKFRRWDSRKGPEDTYSDGLSSKSSFHFLVSPLGKRIPLVKRMLRSVKKIRRSPAFASVSLVAVEMLCSTYLAIEIPCAAHLCLCSIMRFELCLAGLSAPVLSVVSEILIAACVECSSLYCNCTRHSLSRGRHNFR